MATLTVCPAAYGSGMQFRPESGPIGSSGETVPPELSYIADPGEANRLQLRREAGAYVFTDTGATIRPGPCTAVTPNEVRCTALTPERGSLQVQLVDGADTFSTTAAADFLGVDGGEGDDSISAPAIAGTGLVSIDGGPGNDEVTGGDGADMLFGGDDSDVVRGGAGNDQIEGGDGADTIDGGTQNDTLTYRGSAPVNVNLGDPAPDGVAGQGDTLTGIENVSAFGSGNDVVIGDDGPNTLLAGRGANRIDGRGGNDRIYLGDRRDQVFGGAGDDVIEANGKFLRNRTQPIFCGAGSDLVRAPGSSDVLSHDCERVEYLYFFLSSRPVALAAGRTTAVFRWSVECPSGYRCSALLQLRSGRTLLGQAYVPVRAGTRRVSVALTRAGRAVARSGRGTPVQVSVRRDRRLKSGGRVAHGETRTFGIAGLRPWFS